MRVAMLAPISWRTPPRHYGPWELVTSLLTEALVARGVDVTLFATLDSLTAGTLAGVCPRPYSEDPTIDAKVWELLHVSHVFERASEFDLIHNQADFVPLAFSRLVDTPLVTTIHGFSSERIVPVFQRYQDRVSYVAISDADRHPDLRYAATIHHGVVLDELPFDPVGSEDLLFFGRIHPDKGAVEASRPHGAPIAGSSWPASSRIRATTSAASRPRSMPRAPGWSTTAPWAAASARAFWAPRARSSISSTSRSRSGSR